MAQTSLPWGGAVTGDAGPYSADNWSDTWRKLFSRDRVTDGIFPSYLGELTVTNPAGATIRVSSGGATVDGIFYENTANVDLAGAVPGAGSNFYNVVLEKDFVAQTVRLSLLGPDPATPPAPTQVDGVTWEISIATVEITSGGTVTITVLDSRFTHYNTMVSTAMIEDNAIINAKILDATIQNAKLASPVIANTISQFGASGDLALTNSPVLVPGCTTSLVAGTYLIHGTFYLLLQGTAGQYGFFKGQLYSDGVLQAYETTFEDDIPASGNDIRLSLSMPWRLVLASTVTVQLRAYLEAGSTATGTVQGANSRMMATRIA